VYFIDLINYFSANRKGFLNTIDGRTKLMFHQTSNLVQMFHKLNEVSAMMFYSLVIFVTSPKSLASWHSQIMQLFFSQENFNLRREQIK